MNGTLKVYKTFFLGLWVVAGILVVRGFEDVQDLFKTFKDLLEV